jgi:hypothetical protein
MLLILAAAAVAVQGYTVTTDTGFAGQLCTVAPNLAYTAGHVVAAPAREFKYTGPFSTQGLLEVVAVDKVHDVALVRPVGSPFLQWHEVARAEPAVGSRVTFRGRGTFALGWYFDHGDYFGLNQEGNMGFSRPVHPGMSGGCALDEDGHAVGVILGTIVYNHPTTAPEGIAYPLWKSWGKR